MVIATGFSRNNAYCSPLNFNNGSAQMNQPGLDQRHRDKIGEISRKHGNTLIGTLRKQYGPMFAKGCIDQERLGDVLHKLDDHSLSELVREHQSAQQKNQRP